MCILPALHTHTHKKKEFPEADDQRCVHFRPLIFSDHYYFSSAVANQRYALLMLKSYFIFSHLHKSSHI